MTLMLNLTPELEQRLTQEATQHGMPAEQFIVQLLEQHLAARDQSSEVVTLLQSWIDDENVQEQKETGDYLLQVLDEDRLSDRKLFPPELRGVTW